MRRSFPNSLVTGKAMSRASNRGPGTTCRPELLEQRDRVQLEPVLGDPAVDHPVDLQAGEPDLAAGRREAAEGAGVRAGEQDALRDHPLVGRRVQHLEVEVREALHEDTEELDPGVAVERGGLDAVGRVRDVVDGPGSGLCGVVAGVERVDPSERDRPVVLG